MCIPKIGRWAEALRQTLSRVYDPTTRNPVPWLLAGESALALQGASIEPQAIEFRSISQFACVYFAQFMRPYETPVNTATIVYSRGGNMSPADSWRSNVHQRVVEWSAGGRSTWLGRWVVAGSRVQVAHVRNVHNDPVALALSAPVRRVYFEGFEVATVPAEFLLAESALRNDTPMVHRALHVIRTTGHDDNLLNKALSILPAEKASRINRLLEINLIAG